MLKKNKVVPRINEPSSLSPTITEKENLIEIFIKCKDLINADDFSKTDPFIVMHVKRYGQWLEYGRTETIFNSNNPSFVETFLVDKQQMDNKTLKFTLYDSDNMNSKNLQMCKRLATVEIDINQIPSQSCIDYPLKNEEGRTQIGLISLAGVPAKGGIQQKRQVHLHVGAIKITKKRFFNRNDIFLELSREIFKDNFTPIYRVVCILEKLSTYFEI